MALALTFPVLFLLVSKHYVCLVFRLKIDRREVRFFNVILLEVALNQSKAKLHSRSTSSRSSSTTNQLVNDFISLVYDWRGKQTSQASGHVSSETDHIWTHVIVSANLTIKILNNSWEIWNLWDFVCSMKEHEQYFPQEKYSEAHQTVEINRMFISLLSTWWPSQININQDETIHFYYS